MVDLDRPIAPRVVAVLQVIVLRRVAGIGEVHPRLPGHPPPTIVREGGDGLHRGSAHRTGPVLRDPPGQVVVQVLIVQPQHHLRAGSMLHLRHPCPRIPSKIRISPFSLSACPARCDPKAKIMWNRPAALRALARRVAKQQVRTLRTFKTRLALLPHQDSPNVPAQQPEG
jgi:hypothetical protein